MDATPSEAVRAGGGGAAALGKDAVPPLMAATTPENAKVHYHWFVELDRYWTMRSTPNKLAKVLQKLPGMLEELKKNPDTATIMEILDGRGTAAVWAGRRCRPRSTGCGE